MCVNRCDSGCNREISDHNGWSVRGAGMSRRWKIFVAVVLAIPLLLFTGLSVLVDKTIGRKAVWQLIAGTFRGTRARPLTSRTFQPTPARMERGRYLVEGLAACFWCHSEHDPQTSMPLADRLGDWGWHLDRRHAGPRHSRRRRARWPAVDPAADALRGFQEYVGRGPRLCGRIPSLNTAGPQSATQNEGAVSLHPRCQGHPEAPNHGCGAARYVRSC